MTADDGARTADGRAARATVATLHAARTGARTARTVARRAARGRRAARRGDARAARGSIATRRAGSGRGVRRARRAARVEDGAARVAAAVGGEAAKRRAAAAKGSAAAAAAVVGTKGAVAVGRATTVATGRGLARTRRSTVRTIRRGAATVGAAARATGAGRGVGRRARAGAGAGTGGGVARRGAGGRGRAGREALRHGVAPVERVDRLREVALLQLGVGVVERGDVAHRVARPGAVGSVEGLERSVAVDLRVGRNGEGGRVALGGGRDVAVGVQVLPHGEQTVDVGVVQEEGGVEGGKVVEGHVTRRALSAGQRVDTVVDRLERDTAALALLGDTVVGNVEEVGAGRQDAVDLGARLRVVVADRLDRLRIVGCRARALVARVAQRAAPLVPVAAADAGEVARSVRVHLGEGVERVGDLLLALRRVDGDGLVGHGLGHGIDRVARGGDFGPVPVRVTEGRQGVLVSRLVGALELIDDVLSRDEHLLLPQRDVGSVPAGEEGRRVGAVSIAGLRALHAVPYDVRHTVNTGDLVPGHDVAVVSVLESLHGQHKQVPLIRILLQLSDLDTGVYLSVGRTGDEVGVLALGELRVAGGAVAGGSVNRGGEGEDGSAEAAEPREGSHDGVVVGSD